MFTPKCIAWDRGCGGEEKVCLKYWPDQESIYGELLIKCEKLEEHFQYDYRIFTIALTVIDGPKIKGALTRVKELKDAADSDVIDIRPRCDQSPAEQSASHKLPMCASVQDPNTVPRIVEYGLPISNRFGHLIDELELSEQPESTVAMETLHHIPSLKPKLLKPQRNPSRPSKIRWGKQ
ncbi:hypothetical protein BSL78_24546 [Apostichopus japonicus]|uniref:Uncharacterized protein n=1 Tax=Stichopus japonicus TaxID=307972 RepID=A0A2G8JSF3_STIJA|nr:hypothetical protein BSL78_24546 [Apostichopus japonicus]